MTDGIKKREPLSFFGLNCDIEDKKDAAYKQQNKQNLEI